MESHLTRVGCGSALLDHSFVERLAARSLFLFSPYFCLMCPGIYPKMVGELQSQEFLIGYSPDGQFEIIARPGKFFFFRKKKFSSIFSSL